MASYIEEIGGKFGARTSTDSLDIDIEIASQIDIDKAITLLNEIINNSLLEDETLEIERGVILNELSRKMDNPNSYKWELYRDLFYQETEKGRPTLGTAETINNINRLDLLKFQKDLQEHSSCHLLVSGDIKTDILKQSLNTKFENKLSKNSLDKKLLPIYKNERIAVGKYENNKQVSLLLGFRTVPFYHKDRIPLEILETLFGGGKASVFAKRLRYELGAVYVIGCRSYNSIDAGSWLINTATSKEYLYRVLDIIHEEIDRIYNGGISLEELRFAKNKRTKELFRNLQTSMSWNNFHYLNEILDENMRLPEYSEGINNVSLEDIQRVGREYFDKNSGYLVLCGNIEDSDIKTLNYFQ
jgi:predicted Zn-dependent peptidase